VIINFSSISKPNPNPMNLLRPVFQIHHSDCVTASLACAFSTSYDFIAQAFLSRHLNPTNPWHEIQMLKEVLPKRWVRATSPRLAPNNIYLITVPAKCARLHHRVVVQVLGTGYPLLYDPFIHRSTKLYNGTAHYASWEDIPSYGNIVRVLG
jgi:hypothetical protein